MTLPPDIGTDAKAIAEWFVLNHSGIVCGADNEALINDLAGVLSEFRASQQKAGLTERQAEALKFIAGYHAAHGFAPAYRDIAKRFDISTSRAHELVTSLVERGCLIRLPGRARSLALVGRS